MISSSEKQENNNCMQYHKFILFMLSSIFLMACTTSKVTSTTVKAKKRSAKFLLQQLQKNHIDYDWFGCKSKIKFESTKEKASFMADVRIKKDSIIWFRIKKMNIEGLRIKVTPETIEILNRQESEYIKAPFNYLKNEFGLELSFAELQELIVGNPILYKDQDLNSTIIENKNVLKTSETQKSVLKIFMNPKSFLLHEIRGSMKNNSISIEYNEYEEVEKQQVPSKKDVYIDSKDIGAVTVKMTFTKISINEPQKVGYIVPDTYTRVSPPGQNN